MLVGSPSLFLSESSELLCTHPHGVRGWTPWNRHSPGLQLPGRSNVGPQISIYRVFCAVCAPSGAEPGPQCPHPRRSPLVGEAPAFFPFLPTQLRMIVFVSGHLHVKGKEEKMSKSLKNYITIKVLWSSCSCTAASMPGPSGRPRDPSPITSVLWPHSLLPLLGSGGSSFCTSRDSPTPSPLPVAPALLSVPAFLGDLHLSLCFSFHEVFALGPHLLGPPFSTLPHSPPAQQACAAVGSAFAGMLTCLINFRAVG